MSTLGQPVPEQSLHFLAASRARTRDGIKMADSSEWTRAFFELYADEPLRRRQALSFAHALEHASVRLFPNELLVGQVYHYTRGDATPDMSSSDPRWDDFSAAVM